MRLNEDRAGYLLVRATGGTKTHVLPPQERRFIHGARALCGHVPANTITRGPRRGKWYHVNAKHSTTSVGCATCASLYGIAIERETVMKQRRKIVLDDATAAAVLQERKKVVVQMELEGIAGPNVQTMPFPEEPATHTVWSPDVQLVTVWSTERPPVGLWEVTDALTGAMRERWWFGGANWIMSDAPQRDAGRVGGMTHERFAKGHAWRGLAQRPAEAYACPPYDLRTVPKGCELEVRAPIAPRRAPTR